MRYLIYTLLSFLVLIITGCGSNSQLSNNIEEITYEDMVKAKEKDIQFANSDSIKYHSYKPDILGKGLLYQIINSQFRKIKKSYPGMLSGNVKLSVKFVKEHNPSRYDLINEVRIFAKEQGYKFIEPKSVIEKLNTKIVKKGRVRNFDRNRVLLSLFFEYLGNNVFKLYVTDSSNNPIIAPVKFNLNKLEENRDNKWTTVYVPYGNGSDGGDNYDVLKNVVNISDKNFEEADKFCRNKYKNSSVISLYVFEYALRNGQIRAPQSSVYREFVAPYDEDLGDKKYLNYGDKVKIEDDDDTAQSQVLVYNWNTKEYEKVLRNSRGNITFRCMLFKGKEWKR